MSKRVTKTGKDSQGDITSLCGYGWSRTKAASIGDIESGAESYYVQDSAGRTADVHVVNGQVSTCAAIPTLTAPTTWTVCPTASDPDPNGRPGQRWKPVP